MKCVAFFSRWAWKNSNMSQNRETLEYPNVWEVWIKDFLFITNDWSHQSLLTEAPSSESDAWPAWWLSADQTCDTEQIRLLLSESLAKRRKWLQINEHKRTKRIQSAMIHLSLFSRRWTGESESGGGAGGLTEGGCRFKKLLHGEAGDFPLKLILNAHQLVEKKKKKQWLSQTNRSNCVTRRAKEKRGTTGCSEREREREKINKNKDR